MSSGYPVGHPDYFNINNNIEILTGRSISNSNNRQSLLAGILSDTSLWQPDLIRKRSIAEFQHQHLQQQAVFFLRNVKERPFNNTSEISSPSNTSSFSSIPRYGVPVLQNFNFNNRKFNGVMGNYHITNNNNNNPHRVGVTTPLIQETTQVKMMKPLQDLEKQLSLEDESHGGENDVVSGVTNNDWSETLFTPSSDVAPLWFDMGLKIEGRERSG